MLLSSVKPIGECFYYALRIEFQMRGYPEFYMVVFNSFKNGFVAYKQQKLSSAAQN